ncbi:Rrf2 family transcriptional regulator (plasmid) [Nostoc sp. UHCC 0302]|uniref:RrF2 family transcriptional regulator n=1 Tax=Nostoc sp. UHCC 0302 TaxID=3134896 RepID=UPI00311C99AA
MNCNISSTNLNSQNYPFHYLSPKIKYTLMALLELASHYEKKVPLAVREIISMQPIPERYLEHILLTLRCGGLVYSQRGPKGGFVLARNPEQITVREIITSLESESQHTEIFDAPTLERNLVYEICEQAEATFMQVLDSYTLQDLYQKKQAREQQNPMYYI